MHDQDSTGLTAPAPGRDRRSHMCIGSGCTCGVVLAEEREELAAGFGSELRKLRKAAGLTQVQAGTLAGLTSDTVRRFENGYRRPTLQSIGALARTVAPEGQEQQVMGRLADLAGGSCRNGAERKRYAKQNRGRRAALQGFEQDTAKLQRLAAEKRRQGKEVPAHLQEAIETGERTIRTLRQRLTPDLPAPAPVAGARYGSAPPKGLSALEQWLKTNNA